MLLKIYNDKACVGSEKQNICWRWQNNGKLGNDLWWEKNNLEKGYLNLKECMSPKIELMLLEILFL